MTTQEKSPERQEHAGDASRAGTSPRMRSGARSALRFALWTVVNGAILMIVLYLAGLLTRSHSAESYFQGLAADWESYVPMFLLFGAFFTLWNRWLRRRHRARQAKRGDDAAGGRTD